MRSQQDVTMTVSAPEEAVGGVGIGTAIEMKARDVNTGRWDR
jgi:hypothetical protein